MIENVVVKKMPGFLQVIMDGEFSVDSAIKVIDLMIEKSREHNEKRILIDIRNMTGRITVMHRIRIGMYAASLTRQKLATALICREDQMLPDKFLENYLVNRGVRVRVFPNLESGEQWLSKIHPQ